MLHRWREATRNGKSAVFRLRPRFEVLPHQAEVAGVVDSGLPGPKGNREFFLHLTHADDPKLPDDLDEQIDRAVAAG